MKASYGALLAQTMTLVGIALGVLTLGAFVGQDWTLGASHVAFFIGVGLLFAQGFIEPLRRGLVGTVALFGIALALGLGLGPTLNAYVSVQPDAVAQAVGMTTVTVLGAAALGTFMSKDLARWARPLSLAIFVLAIGSYIAFAFGSGIAASPVFSIVFGVISAALIVIDFNYLRLRATEDDVIWLATGIFVSIVNLFQIFLNLSRN
ncbi:MAG: Bax inhibitor-1 family protein [Solirubrobacteraceae bacterium]